jgi:small subunit ribosomal protein S6
LPPGRPVLPFSLIYPTFAAQINFLTNKQGSMNNYELMVIFTPVLSDDDFKGAQKKYTDFIKSIGGEIVHENPWGLKSLAYPIQKKTTGLYWVMEYKAPSNLNEQLKIQLLRDDNVLRHMFTVLDKYAVEYNGKKRSGVPTGTEKVEG